MNKAFKIIGIIVVIVAAVIIGLNVFVKSYLTDARIRSFITETAESSLHRKVSFGAISVSIFSGISAQDFEIKEKETDTFFLKADAFALKYRLLPLISRRLVIDELGIESPRIVIRKNADGSFNFSDMIREKGPAAAEQKGGEPSGLPISLNVQSLRIHGARLEYSDQAGAVKKVLVGLDADMSIRGRSTEVFGSTGKAEMKLLELILKDRPTSVRDVPVSLKYNAEVSLAEKKIEISDASVTGLGVAASMKGAVNYGEPMSFAVEANTPSVNLAEVQKAAAAFLPPGIGLSGVLSIKVAAKRNADEKTALSGEVRLDKVAAQIKNMKPVFSGTLSLSPEQIVLKSMKLVAGSSSADISGSIANYSKDPNIRIDITSPMLNLDSIMPSPGKEEAAPIAQGREKRKEKEMEPMKTKAEAEGNVDISTMLYKGITVRRLKAHYTFHDNVFTLASLTGDTLSGSFTARSTVNLSKSGTAYTVNVAADGIKLEDIAAVFAPKAKGSLFGSLSAHADISGAGSVRETIKRNLKGKGAFTVKNGKIKGAPISDGLLALLGLQSLKEIPMEKAAGTFTISGGVIDLKSAIASKDLGMDETGTIGMDEKLNMGILVKVSDRLSPNVLAQSGISQFISEEKGWTTLPLKLTGTIAKPSYGVDTQAIGKRATQAIQKKAEEEIFKSLSGEKKKEQKPADTQKKGITPEDLLKGLFR